MFVYLSAKLPEGKYGKRVCTQRKPFFLVCTIILIASSNVMAVEVRANFIPLHAMVGRLPLGHGNNVRYSEETIRRSRSERAVSVMGFSSPT